MNLFFLQFQLLDQIKHLHARYFSWFFSSADFLKNNFFKKHLGVNSLNPDQARHFVGPDLAPKCLQRLSADDKIYH